MNEKTIVVKFRWPVELGPVPNTVEVKVQYGSGPPLVKVNEDAAERLHLSHAEYDALVDKLTEVAIREVMIVK